jgi:uncharacterized membrane protein YgcG
MSMRAILLIISASFLALLFNNCERFIEKPKWSNGDNQNYSSNTDNIPWPNKTTTYLQSDLVASDVLFGDVNKNNFQDAVFISRSSQVDVSVSSLSQASPMIRVVLAGNYSEQLNVNQLSTLPNPDVRMLLVDTDVNDGDLELVYLSHDGQYIVVLGLNGSRFGQELHKIAIKDRVNTFRVRGFISRRLARSLMVEIGTNTVFFESGRPPQIFSSTEPIHGDWSAWSEPVCSKTCGTNGVLYSMRTCTQPSPMNGGMDCVGPFHRLESCEELPTCTAADCRAHEMLDSASGNCIPNPDYIAYNSDNSRSGGGTGGGGTGGGGTGGGGTGGGIVNDPTSCPPGKVWDSKTNYCFTPYSFPNIRLSREECTGFGEDRTCETFTYPLSINHSMVRNISHETQARSYCWFRGYRDYLDFSVRRESNVSRVEDRRAFVLCHREANQMSWYDSPYCRPQNASRNSIQMAAYSHRQRNGSPVIHPSGSDIEFLDSVTCRLTENFVEF